MYLPVCMCVCDVTSMISSGISNNKSSNKNNNKIQKILYEAQKLLFALTKFTLLANETRFTIVPKHWSLQSIRVFTEIVTRTVNDFKSSDVGFRWRYEK